MPRTVIGILSLLLLLPAARAQEERKDEKPKGQPKTDKPATSDEQLKALMAEVRKEHERLSEAYQAAKTAAEKKEVEAEFHKSLGRFLEFAQKHPRDKAAFNAIIFVVGNVPSGPMVFDKAVDLLLKDHANNENMGEVCRRLARGGLSPAVEKLIRGVVDKSTNHKVQGEAIFTLAQALKARTESGDLKPAAALAVGKEAEDLFAKIVAKFADLEGLADAAKGELFELRNLAIGKEAPNITGEDSDGKKFNLSDYRGKVVVLDFWAKW